MIKKKKKKLSYKITYWKEEKSHAKWKGYFLAKTPNIQIRSTYVTSRFNMFQQKEK